MTPASRWLLALLGLAAVAGACGRTGPLRYASDGGEDTDGDAADAGVDAGFDAGHVTCTPGTIALTRATPRVMFVLDKSGSMDSAFGTLRLSRWRSLTTALSNVLPPVDQTMELGALLFPSGAGDTCSVSSSANLQPGFGNVGPMLTLMRATAPSGHTPTAMAMYQAASVLVANRAATSARALVLATDGAPNCNASLNPNTCACASGSGGVGGRCLQSILCLDDARSISTIASLEQINLPTYVIGIQDTSSAAIEVLNQMAIAGGRPRAGAQAYYAVSSEPELESALTAIRNQVGKCVYLTSSVPDELGSIVLSVNGSVVPYDPNGHDGWWWSNKSNGELEIEGHACDVVAATPNPTLTVEVRCEPPDAGLDGG